MDEQSRLYLMVVILLLFLLVGYRMALHASRDANSKFDFAESFLDVNGKTSLPRIGYFAALVVSVWALVVLVLTEQLTEWYYSAFLGAFVLGAVTSKIFEKPSGDKP